MPTIYRSGDVLVRLGGEGTPAVTRQMGVDMMTHVSSRTAWWYKEHKNGEIEQLPLERIMRDMLTGLHPPDHPLAACPPVLVWQLPMTCSGYIFWLLARRARVLLAELAGGGRCGISSAAMTSWATFPSWRRRTRPTRSR